MKKIVYAILGVSMFLSGCGEDFVDSDTLTLISDIQVWQDELLVNAYINNIYDEVDFVNASGQGNFNMGFDGAMGAEFRTFGAWQDPYRGSTNIIQSEGAHSQLNYWKYQQVREINTAILQLSEVSNLSQGFIDDKVTELRFLRAYVYFQMVKRYGGVPILTKPQAFDTPQEELLVSRNSEQEVYDFVISELDAIVEQLPGEPIKGRPSKWAALALQSRAALYAGSIGEFGEVQLDGLLGIPNPNFYWQKAYDASKMIIDDSGHVLYLKNEDDRAQNFQDLFIDEDNAEVIFSEIYDGDLKAHSFSNLCMPDGFNAGWGSNYNVFYDMVELFDFEDGSSGKIDRSLIEGQRWTAADLFGKRDPRFRASVFYPESPWQGSTVYFHTKTTNANSAPEGWPNVANKRNRVRTGLHLRKRLDEGTLLPPGGTDDTDYIVFRLGEVYLNLAEAAFYLGKTTEALEAVNTIRDRAGMPLLATVSEEKIRHERQVELFAEDHRYWDLRRWRIAVEVLNGVSLKGLKYEYDGISRDYKISFSNAENVERVFQERNYYLPLGLSRLADNHNLVENPGY
ncbi:MAG: RagB/SusD family nutrient uptake outer membrane protein [Flavobacteriaceae bacterium]